MFPLPADPSDPPAAMTLKLSMHRALRATLLATAVATLGAAPGLLPAAMAASAPSTAAIAWQEASGDADIERAFQQATSEKKPVLLYWGAKWCPPCNQLKATLFNRADFIEQSRAFVAVHIDGDNPGAQRLGARFKVRGYPTMILFSNQGQELTRLPGEADAAQVLQVLQLGLAGGRPVKSVLADAQAGRKLSASEWKLLGFYGWEIDEQQLVPANQRPALLARLAQASQGVDEDTSTRLWLKALASSGESGKPQKPQNADAALRARVDKVLADPAASRVQVDVLANSADDIALALAPTAGPDRQALVARLDTALKRYQADTTLSRADRLQALLARVELARLDQPKMELQPKLDAALLAEVKAAAAKVDQEVTDGYERQAVITSAAHVLGRAGLWSDSDALLKASLAKSHSPYYLMSYLGGNARKQGRNEEALRWYEEAFNRSEGPATRLQWGSNYLSALVELAPQDSARIEKAASQLLAEADKDKGAFYERSARSLQKVGSQLTAWNAKGQHADSIKRLRAQLDGVCAKQSERADKAVCEGLLKKG
ncbi:thioredoxin fold domain-containing protein [Roseateles sp. SL47]|uniref:thioredoxin family protein n=1 Tax=Roseateles sp. SL47 TaxID=2995138 RepID=UPI00226E638D|nr:thioredoxin fold domain-containing protein [Roseateles sp. SL47]WAC74050.1 thioredoxin fold domain-containing protein [Roseateles sp. SL47]